MTSDKKFFAWLDGELTGNEAAEIEAKVASDPRLSELANQHRALASQLRGTFGAVVDEPVPEHLAAATRRRGEVIDIGKTRRAGSRSWAPMPQWAAIAATLVLGLFIGLLVSEPGRAPVEMHGGAIYAAASLDQALDTELASAPGSGDVRVGLTFRDRTGAICRSFTGIQASGLACRDGDRWRLRGMFAAPGGHDTEYRMAAGMDPNLAMLIDSTIAGEPFDAAQERAAKQGGWQ